MSKVTLIYCLHETNYAILLFQVGDLVEIAVMSNFGQLYGPLRTGHDDIPAVLEFLKHRKVVRLPVVQDRTVGKA